MGRAELCLSTPFPGLQCSPGSCEAFPGLWTQFKFISSDRSSLPLVSSPVSGSPALEDPSPGPMGLKASTPAAVFYPCMSPSSLPHIVCVLSRSVMSDSLRPHGLQPARFLCSWQEYWTGLPSPSPGNLPDLLQADCLPSEPRGKALAFSRSEQCLATVSPLHILDESGCIMAQPIVKACGKNPL